MIKLAIILGLVPCYFFAKKIGGLWSVSAYILGAFAAFYIYKNDAILENSAPLTRLFRSQLGNLYENIIYRLVNMDRYTMFTLDVVVKTWVLLLVILFLWLILLLGGFYVSTETILIIALISFVYGKMKSRSEIKRLHVLKNYYMKFPDSV